MTKLARIADIFNRRSGTMDITENMPEALSVEMVEALIAGFNRGDYDNITTARDNIAEEKNTTSSIEHGKLVTDIDITTKDINMENNMDPDINDSQPTSKMFILDELAAADTESDFEVLNDMMDITDQYGHAPVVKAVTGKHPSIDMKIKILPHGKDLPLPAYQSKLASGMDLYATNDIPIFLNSMGTTVMIDTGIVIAVPEGYEAQIRPRSGLAAKHGITVTNTPGTIDADYRGEIKVLLTNLTGRRFTVEKGMRIAQMVICPIVQANLIEVDDLNQTERGDKGHGSTGV